MAEKQAKIGKFYSNTSNVEFYIKLLINYGLFTHFIEGFVDSHFTPIKTEYVALLGHLEYQDWIKTTAFTVKHY